MPRRYAIVDGKRKLVRCKCTHSKCAQEFNTGLDRANWKYDYFNYPSPYDKVCQVCGFYFYYKK